MKTKEQLAAEIEELEILVAVYSERDWEAAEITKIRLDKLNMEYLDLME